MTIIGPFPWEGGWNTKAKANTLPQDQYCDAQDVQLVYGDLIKRSGSTALSSSAFGGTSVIHGLYDWQTAAGQRYFIVTAGTKIGQMADLGGTFTDVTGAVTITSGQNNQSTFSSLNNLLVRCGGTTPDAPIKWSGTGNAAALGGSPPSGNLTTTVNNFMFIGGTAANPSRVYWSNVIDPETWGAANYVDFRKDDGDKVTALAPILGQTVAIFKRRCIGNLETNPPSTAVSVTLGPLTTVVYGIGCVGAQALDVLPDGRIVFLAPNSHVYIYDGSPNLVDISDPEPPTSNIQPTLDVLPPGRLPYAVLKVYPTRKQVWLSVSTGSNTTNDTIYVYDYELGVWLSPFTHIAANAMTCSIDTRANPSHSIVLFTGNYSEAVYEQDKGNSNAEVSGGAIDGYATKSIQLSKNSTDFIPIQAIVPLESQGLFNIQFNYGYEAFTEVTYSNNVSMNSAGGILDFFILDTDVLGAATYVRRLTRLVSRGRATSIQYQVRNSLSGQPFNVHPISISDEVVI